MSIFTEATYREGSLTGEDYYAKPAISASLLKCVNSPELFLGRWKQVESGIPDPRDAESPAMRKGSMLDDLVFNPAKKYAPKPKSGYRQGQTHDDETGAEWIAPSAYRD